MSLFCPIQNWHVASMPSWLLEYCLNWYVWRYTNRSIHAWQWYKEECYSRPHRSVVSGIWQDGLHLVQCQNNNSNRKQAGRVCERNRDVRFLSGIFQMVRRWGRVKSPHLRSSRNLRQLPPCILELLGFIFIEFWLLAINGSDAQEVSPPCAIREQRKLPLKWIYKIDGEFSRRAPIFRKAAQHLESMFGLCIMLLAMGLQLGDCPPVLNIWCKDTDNLWCTQKISLKFYVHAINKPIFLYRSNESCIFIRQNRKNFAFCFVYRLFLRTFANDHRYDVQVWTPVWLLWVKTITALAVIRRVWNVTVLGTNANDNWLMSALMAWTYHLSAFRYLSQPQTRISVHAFFVSVWLVEYL